MLGYFNPTRRIDTITKLDTALFKAALAKGELSHVNTRETTLTSATVDLHLRNARTMFEYAEGWGFVMFNPFKRKKGERAINSTPAKSWHIVTDKEFTRLIEYTKPAWRLLLALCRHAALRRGEALNLQWGQIDWEQSRLTIIANDEWQPKDKEPRIVPIVPALRTMLLEAFDLAEPGTDKVIPDGAIAVKNISRDFSVLCERAGVKRYAKPLHTLRKTCLTEWAREFPQHVVTTWAGHGKEETTSEYYLQVSEQEFDKAAGIERKEKTKSLSLQ